MPELRQLRAFVAVAEELNFTRAAERLFLGQQAVSKSIRQLERELGVVLLERTTHEVRLTAAGAELLRDGRGALKAADTAFERAPPRRAWDRGHDPDRGIARRRPDRTRCTRPRPAQRCPRARGVTSRPQTRTRSRSTTQP